MFVIKKLVINVPPRMKNAIFEDPDKTKKLEKLLQSKNPQDLEEANRLIKLMVKQDEIKTEKISLRINELDQVNNNVKLLNEMLFHYNKSSTSESEKETMKVCVFFTSTDQRKELILCSFPSVGSHVFVKSKKKKKSLPKLIQID
jgi:hypothetical protein